MEVDEVTFDRVFLSSRILKIPFFQRGYVWCEDNWRKFFDDLVEVAQDIEETGSAKDYFIGSIILKMSKDGESEIADVIDGQQRLTTMVLFMKALCLAMNKDFVFKQKFYQTQMDLDNEPEPILMPNYTDKVIYHSILQKEILKSTTQSENKMAQAFAYFAKRIVDSRDVAREDHVSLKMLYDAFTKKVRMVVIEVSAEEDAQKIFETINCTGIKLTTGEMLKNYLFDDNCVEEYEKIWRPVFEVNHQNYWESAITKGRQSDSHIENFFYHYMLIKVLQPEIKEKLSATERKNYRKKSGLYEKFCNLIQKCKIAKEDEVKDIVKFATLYVNTFKADTLEECAPSCFGVRRLAYFMFMTNTWTAVPYILYILSTVENENERVRIFQYMEIYLMRRMICKGKNNSYSDLFSENLIGSQISTFEGFKKYVNDAENRGNLLMPSDAAVLEAVSSNDLKSDAGVILYMLESKLNRNFSKSERNNCYQTMTKEQVMPSKIDDVWTLGERFSDEEHIALSNTLGNYVLLREKLSSKMKAAAWRDKRRSIKELAADMDLSNISENPQWTEKEIQFRNEGLGKKILEAWPM